MTGRRRIAWFGSAALAVVAGIVCASVASAIALEAIGIFVTLVGFLALLMLVYFEVGRSEDRDRARRPR